jgi:hypothetical protein
MPPPYRVVRVHKANAWAPTPMLAETLHVIQPASGIPWKGEPEQACSAPLIG